MGFWILESRENEIKMHLLPDNKDRNLRNIHWLMIG